MFQLKNISKQFGQEYALRNINLEIRQGFNFIVGASGSGKTTLLKILSGMELDYDGEVFFGETSMKSLSDQDRSYYYNNIFGFVWQDFHLLEDMTVLENVLLPMTVKTNPATNVPSTKSDVIKILKQLKISEIADQKVKQLSGGQKQRVAIARELMKNPKVIIADEPTSALDEKTSKTTMEILRDLSKSRIVIVVTHDISLLDANAAIFELDKGELISKPEVSNAPIKGKMKTELSSKASFIKHALSFKKASSLSIQTMKRKPGRTMVSLFAILLSTLLFMVSANDLIANNSESAFDELYETYGKGILDISLVGSFMSASGTSEEDEGPSADVTQDIGGLYDEYLHDERVEHMVFSQAFDNITVTVDNQSVAIEKSGNVPVLEKLTEGAMPMGDGPEVVIPKSLLAKLGMKEKDIIGKTLEFNAAIFNWDTGEPILKPVSTKATIVGVTDTTVVYEYMGEKMEYSIDDSFFFSKSALDDMRLQAGVSGSSVNFTMRAKTPHDLISLKDELNAKGIVPLGRFELVEDMVRLNQNTKEQSGSATVILAMLSLVIALSITLLTAFMRKKEYAIYKISGFSRKHLVFYSLTENMIISIGGIFLLLLGSPLWNAITTKLFGAPILVGYSYFYGVVFYVAFTLLCFLFNALVAVNTSILIKKGDK